jgi:hypothetical protein
MDPEEQIELAKAALVHLDEEAFKVLLSVDLNDIPWWRPFKLRKAFREFADDTNRTARETLVKAGWREEHYD